MDSWERFDENTIPPKEAFYSKLNLKEFYLKEKKKIKQKNLFVAQKTGFKSWISIKRKYIE